MKKTTFFLASCILFVMPFFVSSQSAENAAQVAAQQAAEGITSSTVEEPDLEEFEGGFGWAAPENVKGQVDCFDYYTFQSVQVSMGADVSAYEQGRAILFSGNIINQNDHPIVDGNVFVRITRTNENGESEGHYIIDEFIALENLSLSAGEVQLAEFTWQLPNNIKGGEYRADYFFSVGKKFNLGGLPFSNEIIVGSVNFTVDSENESFISFDRSKTTINGEKYPQIGDSPLVQENERVTVKQILLNTYLEPKTIQLVYDLYFWDSLNEEDKIKTTYEEFTIPANAQKEIEYVIENASESVYYLKMTAISESEKSIINTRFVSGISRPRLNYPAITKFPVEKGDDFTMFSCYHSASMENAQGTVKMTLTDKTGDKIDSFEYTGPITSDMAASKKDINASKDYRYIKLVAVIHDDKNNLVDSYETVYDCDSSNLCNDEIRTITTEEKTTSSSISLKKILFLIFLIIPIATIAGILIKNKMK